MRSTMSLPMACILLFFRIRRHPFLTFPSGTSSKIRGALPCAALLSLKIEPVCDSLQAGRVFFDVIPLSDL